MLVLKQESKTARNHTSLGSCVGKKRTREVKNQSNNFLIGIDAKTKIYQTENTSNN